MYTLFSLFLCFHDDDFYLFRYWTLYHCKWLLFQLRKNKTKPNKTVWDFRININIMLSSKSIWFSKNNENKNEMKMERKRQRKEPRTKKKLNFIIFGKHENGRTPKNAIETIPKPSSMCIQYKLHIKYKCFVVFVDYSCLCHSFVGCLFDLVFSRVRVYVIVIVANWQ